MRADLKGEGLVVCEITILPAAPENLKTDRGREHYRACCSEGSKIGFAFLSEWEGECGSCCYIAAGWCGC